jgi:hypothetical protein
MGEACQALRATSRPKSYVFAVKCEGANPSLIAILATSHQDCTRAAIRLNSLRDRQQRLGGIVSLIALNGPLGLEGQIPIRTRLRTTGAFNDIEFDLTEVHEPTLARETPHTANLLCNYCISSASSWGLVVIF